MSYETASFRSEEQIRALRAERQRSKRPCTVTEADVTRFKTAQAKMIARARQIAAEAN
jgi:hypothetical protein